jgi:hypothetical protein
MNNSREKVAGNMFPQDRHRAKLSRCLIHKTHKMLICREKVCLTTQWRHYHRDGEFENENQHQWTCKCFAEWHIDANVMNPTQAKRHGIRDGKRTCESAREPDQ